MQGRNDVKTFGELIKCLRKERGVSLYDLEKEVQISPGYISRLERGSRLNPTMVIIGRLSKFFDFKLSSIEELFPEFQPSSVNDMVTLDKLIFNSDFMFPLGVRANLDVKLSLQKIVKYIQEYVIGENDLRGEEALLLQEIDKLKVKIKSA